MLRLYLAATFVGYVLVALGVTLAPALLIPGMAAAALGQGALIVTAIRHGDRSDERPAGGWR